MESEQSLGDLQDTLKQTRIHRMGILEEGKNRVREIIWRNNGWKLPKFEDLHRYTNPRISTPST